MSASIEKIGDALVAKKILPKEEWRRANALAAQSNQNVRVVLDRLGLVAQEAWARTAAATLNLQFIDIENQTDALVTHPDLTLEFQLANRVAVIAEDDKRLALAMADPTDDYAVRAVSLATGKSVVTCVAIERAIEARLRSAAPASTEVDAPVFSDVEDFSELKNRASDAPVVRYVDNLVAEALKRGASDIHLEPYESRMTARMRIDGALEPGDGPPAGDGDAVVSRFKILAGLDIAERRLPQDGRIRMRIEGRKVDLRIVTSPCLHGESIVLRILAQDLEKPSFASLGFDRGAVKAMEKLLAARHGMMVVTGPTGSGKTTSLYAALDRVNDGARKIITVEDPVEYQVDGVVQIPVRADIGRGFANSLRSILRQDPDVIMVGEIRDGETAQIAARAALTGHLVLSTLHTNDAPSAVTRLHDMGLEPFLIAATLRGVIAQRLVRRLCPHCRAPAKNPIALPEAIQQLAGVGVAFNEPVGCEACGGRGYKGRLGVYEIMPVDTEIAQLIISGADAARIRAVAAGKGMRTLLEDALVKAATGETSLAEAYAVCGEA